MGSNCRGTDAQLLANFGAIQAFRNQDQDLVFARSEVSFVVTQSSCKSRLSHPRDAAHEHEQGIYQRCITWVKELTAFFAAGQFEDVLSFQRLQARPISLFPIGDLLAQGR